MRIVILLVAASMAFGTACSKPEGPERLNARVQKQLVLAAEDAYVSAEIDGDEKALRELVDDRFQFNSADGTTSGKEELIDSVLAMNMTGQTITERSVMVEGDVAVIFGTAELRSASPDGETRVSTLRYTSVYVRRGDDWRMLALQMAPRSQPEQ